MKNLPIIQFFHSLRDFGVFRRYSHSADSPSFLRYNLIFGFNGTGKTTLSRLLRCLELGRLTSTLPRNGRFKIRLSNDVDISNDQNLAYLQSSLATFNIDFTNEHLRWSDASANPVYYIGPDVARLSQLLERVERRIPFRQEQVRHASDNQRAAENAFNEFKTALARQIGSELNIARQYNRTVIDNDYSGPSITKCGLLDSPTKSAYRSLLTLSGPTDQIHIPSFPFESYQKTFESLSETLLLTISSIALSEFEHHSSMLFWAATGLDYHEQHALDHCLLCGGPLSADRKQALRVSLTGRFKEYLQRFPRLRGDIQQHAEFLKEFIRTLPHQRDISPELAEAFETSVQSFQAAADALRVLLESAAAALSQKETQLTTSLRLPANDAGGLPGSTLATLRQALHDVADVVERHNQFQNDFSARRAHAAEALKYGILLEHVEQYAQHRKALDTAAHELGIRVRLLKSLQSRVQSIRNTMRDHGPAVSELNRLLYSYLGHAELSLRRLDVGYEICRNGRKLDGPLSEGERTAIALCYFICKIKEDGRSVKDLIIVIDDPVSSLDLGGIHYANSMILCEVIEARQVFIMTHNFDFLTESRNWMRRLNQRSPKGQLQCAFFSVKQYFDHEAGQRYSVIGEMPKLLRAYDSEYHYLFSLVNEFVSKGGQSTEAADYMMPHLIRRLLEAFLAFKIPDSRGLDEKLKDTMVVNSGVDVNKVTGLSRLSHLGSHSQTIDGMTKFSPVLMEESLNAAKILFELMRAVDSDHFDRFCKLCA